MITEDQLQTLRHMLGIDDPSRKEPVPYRDYYCASRGDSHLQAMAGLGLVEMYSQQGNYDWYRTTDSGKSLAIESHKKIRYPKGKRVYLAFLRMADATGCTFKDFLTNPEYKETRKAA